MIEILFFCDYTFVLLIFDYLSLVDFYADI